MNYIRIDQQDVANGAGIGVVLWVSGCSLNCWQCHNPETHDFNAGTLFGHSALEEIREGLLKPWTSRLTLTGGHPLEDKNLAEVYLLCRTIRKEFPQKQIWLYTGLTLQEAQILEEPQSLLERTIALCDVIVDGPYVAQQRDLSLKFKGSRNQRLIDIKKSKFYNKIMEWNDEN